MNELSITFTLPKTHIYEPGDEIRGSVFFIPHFSARLRSLIISLHGHCYTSSLVAGTKVAHTVPFLHLTSSTLQEAYTYIGERYEAPFTFEMPEYTDVVEETGPLKLRGLFNQGPQLLPSSVVVSARSCVQMVRYFIEVEVHGRQRAVCEETVLFRQGSAAAQALWSPFAIGNLLGHDNDSWATVTRSEWSDYQPRKDTWRSDMTMFHQRLIPERIDNSHESRKLSSYPLPILVTHHKRARDRYHHAKTHHDRSRLQWLFRWKQPKAVFMPSIHCPRTITVGHEIPLILVMETVENPSWIEIGKDTPMLLQDFKLVVTAHSRTIMQTRPRQGRWGRCIDLPYVVFDAKDLNAPISMDGRPTRLLERFQVLHGTIPNFATYTISRCYTLDLHLVCEFGGEELEWDASINLAIKNDDSTPLVNGARTDPLLLVDPKQEAKFFWKSRIEIGAADCAERNAISPGPSGEDQVGAGMQWDFGHGRLSRSSYACASARLDKSLMRVTTGNSVGGGKHEAPKISTGIAEHPKVRFIRDLEPVIEPSRKHRQNSSADVDSEPESLRGESCEERRGNGSSETRSYHSLPLEIEP